MLDLVRLSPRALFPPGGQELYRQVARLTRMDGESEVLVAGCGAGITVEYFARDRGARASGVDPDPILVERAEARVRESGLSHKATFQVASAQDLPYRDGIFDVVVGELSLAVGTDEDHAIRELVRVLRPGGRIALIQLVWKAPVDPGRREILARHLGARPLMLVEWKRLLRSAGIRQLHTEDWSDEETAFRPQGVKPFPDFAELFSLPEKLGILRRAWGRWGWQGVKVAVAREAEVHRLLTRERILGLDLLVGRAPEAGDLPPAEPPPQAGAGEPSSPDGEEEGPPASPPDGGVAGPGPQPSRDLSGLPLFTQGRPET
jgi:ubiquinone/menaquinone biosynthesis C-methylase UbiE